MMEILPTKTIKGHSVSDLYHRIVGRFPSAWGGQSRFGLLFEASNERNGDSPIGPMLSVSEYRGVEARTREAGQQPSADVSHYRVVRPGQLAVNLMWLDHGGLGVSEYAGYISPAYKAYNIAPAINQRFAHYLLRCEPYAQVYQSLGTGVRPNSQMVDSIDLDSLPIPLPDLNTQCRIADYLDRETAQIDAMMAKLNEQVDLLRERKKLIIPNLIDDTRPVAVDTPVWKLFKPVNVQERPEEAVLSLFRDHGVVHKGTFEDKINKLPKDLSKYQLVEPNDLVVNKMKAWQGSLAISKYRGIISPDYQVAKPITNDNPEYLHLVLRDPRMIGYYRVNSTGIRPDQWRLYWQELSSLRIPLPSLAVQNRVVRSAKSQMSRTDVMIDKCNQLRDLLQERRAALITAVVTGQKSVPGNFSANNSGTDQNGGSDCV